MPNVAKRIILGIAIVVLAILSPLNISTYGVTAPSAHAKHSCPEGQTAKHVGTGTYGTIVISSCVNEETGERTIKEPPLGTCDFWCDIRKGIAGAMLGFSSFILWIAGELFNFSITHTVEKMAEFVSEIGGIDVAWRVIRDLVNMIFIFALLYISIATILRIEEYGARKLLARLVIIALLINFSLFFTKVIIDVSNVLSAEFINGIRKLNINQEIGGAVGKTGIEVTEQELGGISGAFMNAIDITNLYDSSGTVSDDNILTIGIAGSIFLLITAFIFFSGAMLLIVRFVSLIFLMVTSPIAFAGMVLPATKQYAKQWWEELTKQAIFAPVYMALLLVVAVIIKDKEFQTRLVGDSTFADLTNPATAATTVGSTGPIGVVLNFIIVSGLMIMALVTAQKLGIRGAQGLSSLGKRMGVGSAKWLGKRGLRYAGGKWNELTSRIVKDTDDDTRAGKARKAAFAVLNPVAFGKGWEKRAKERLEERRVMAEGAGEEVASWIQTFGKEKMPDKELARRRLVNQRARELREAMGDDIDKADARDFYKRVQNVPGLQGELLREAYLKVINSQGFGDDMTEVTAQGRDDDGVLWRDKLGLSEAESQRYNDEMYQLHTWASVGLDPEVLGRLRTNEGYENVEGRRYIDSDEYQEWLSRGDVQEKLKVMADLTPLVKKVGHYEQMYTAVRDEELGAYRPVVDEQFVRAGETQNRTERSDMIEGEVVKIGSRELMQNIAWHNLVPKEWDQEAQEWKPGDVVDEHGNYLLTEHQRRTMSETIGQDASQANRMAPRTVMYTIGQWLNKDGSFKGNTRAERSESQRQFEAFRNLNETMVDAFRDIYLGENRRGGGGSGGGSTPTPSGTPSGGGSGSTPGSQTYPPGTILRPTSSSNPSEGTPV